MLSPVCVANETAYTLRVWVWFERHPSFLHENIPGGLRKKLSKNELKGNTGAFMMKILFLLKDVLFDSVCDAGFEYRMHSACKPNYEGQTC